LKRKHNPECALEVPLAEIAQRLFWDSQPAQETIPYFSSRKFLPYGERKIVWIERRRSERDPGITQTLQGKKQDATRARTTTVLSIPIPQSLNLLPKEKSNRSWEISPMLPDLLPIWHSQSGRPGCLSPKGTRTHSTTTSAQRWNEALAEYKALKRVN
jgi:hypothetical protein